MSQPALPPPRRHSQLDSARRRQLMDAASGALGDTVPLTEVRLPGDRCSVCGTKDGPLHPSEPERVADGLVRDGAVCTEHLQLPQ